MNYNKASLIPFIPASEFDSVATDFLEIYCPEALKVPMKIPIEDIAKNGLGLDVKYVCLSEELDIFGMTIFDDCKVEIYDPVEGLYDEKLFKRKTVLIDPEAVKKTNIGCRNNTIAHECVHWFKHRMYFKMKRYVLPRQAKYCKCRIDQIPFETEDEDIMESQANGIAPRILMPKNTFSEMAIKYGVGYGKDNWKGICMLAEFFQVSKQSAKIRLDECGII